MKKIILGLIVAVLAALLGFRLYEELSTESAAAETGFSGDRRSALTVGTAAAEEHIFTRRLSALGELRPQAIVEVGSKVTGRLERVLVERGDSVQTGQLIAVVDDIDILQQIRRAEASVLVARATVSREEATLENLRTQARRYRELHKDALVSTQDLDEVESRMRAAQAELELAQAQVEQAQASLEELRTQQRQTQIYSPLTGFVQERHLYPGALVNASTPIVTVVDISLVKTVVPAPESALANLQVGLRSEVKVDAFPQQTYQGRVTRISPVLDPETRSADVEIEIDNTGRQLRPGMFARVTIDASLEESALAIPRAALITRGSQQGVFIPTEGNTVVFRPVEIGRIQDDIVEVTSGLAQGEVVISTGAQQLNEGDSVRTE